MIKIIKFSSGYNLPDGCYEADLPEETQDEIEVEIRVEIQEDEEPLDCNKVK